MNPSPYTELIQSWAKLWQAGFAPVWETYQQWANSWEAYQLGQSQVGQTPAQKIWQYGRSHLLHYLPTASLQCPIPILIIPSLINRYYILDLLPDRSLVKYLVAQGFDVYLLDWGRPTAADSHLTFDDHITIYVHQAIETVKQNAGAEQVTLLGYCMGGLFSAVYTSLFGSQVANLINLAGPINFHDDGIFSLMTRADWFNADRLVETYGNIPADLLCWAFQMIRPTGHLVRALLLYEQLENRDYVRNFAAMQTWIFDQVDFPGETFRRYVKALYQENQLVNGRFTIQNRPVHLSHITCPLLNITSKQDETAPWQSVVILNEQVGSHDQELLMLKGPHVGMVAGSSAPKQFWPHLATWLKSRSGS